MQIALLAMNTTTLLHTAVWQCVARASDEQEGMISCCKCYLLYNERLNHFSTPVKYSYHMAVRHVVISIVEVDRGQRLTLKLSG